MPDQLSVYNAALIQMKASPLADLTEYNEARRVLDALWDGITREMLEAGFWKFAIRTVEITKDPDIAPAFGLNNAFNMPSDWVKTYDVSASEMMDPPLDDWIEESNLLFSNAEPIYMRYVSNENTGYGMDLNRWTARFEKAVAFQLAARGAPKGIGASDNALENLQKDADRALSEAKMFESIREPPRRPPAGRWVSQRFRFPARDYRRA